MSEPTHRERCYQCLRPVAMCYCDGLPSVPTTTRMVVLQHPHERTHPFGTARLVRMCLPNSSLHVPKKGFTGTLECRVDVPPKSAVLFPHPDAPDLAELSPADRPECLIAIDGTWGHAKRLYRENTWLHDLPHVRLNPSAPSRYRIRKEPRVDYISTLEALIEALRILEPQTDGLDDVVSAFDRMIDRQIEHTTSNPRVSRFARKRRLRARSSLLTDPRLVAIYCEAPLPADKTEESREVLQWTAARLDRDETFEAIIKPVGELPCDNHLRHMQISKQQLERGVPIAEARARFHVWLDDAPLATWTGSSLVWGKSMLPPDRDHTILKTSYCNTAQRSAGFLEQVVEREQLQVAANNCHGRAATRLANTLAVARWLRDRSLAENAEFSA